MVSPRPIAVFDSGVGGLTVVRALNTTLPDESIVYLGDSARLPYGDKSPEVVQRYASACAGFLLTHDVKMLVVACNTASAFALEHLRKSVRVPVVGVIEPGAQVAAARSRGGNIGVIATHGTVNSGSYQKSLARLIDSARVRAAACPLFVPLAEEDMAHHPATRLIAETYLRPLLAENIDTLVLGCTHYPLLRPVIADICGNDVTIVDSAQAVAVAVGDMLRHHDLVATERCGPDQFFATDVGARLTHIGSTFLGRSLGSVTWVDISA